MLNELPIFGQGINQMETDQHYTDAGLLEGLRTDQPGAFENLFNKHWQDLYTRAYKRLRDQSEAEDMVQDIFASIWDRRYQLEITGSLQGYLRTSLKYKIIKWAGRDTLHKEALSHLLYRMEEMEDTILDAMAANDLKKSFEDAVQTFPENMRRIFTLRAENYTVAEIAEALGLAEQTVKNNNVEALRRLKVILSAKHPHLHKSFLTALALLILN
ncbi:RNA polymerase sigma factor (possible RNA polymerase sigma-24 factor) [Pedobacter sp. BAL39]|nr:RNA polymerase sigma factor (possible RNA polymerase sigma-24 factor) [Pedobacter sp. BAL39]